MAIRKIGLTGGIGSGKSTVAKLLEKQGFCIIDADQIARDIVEPGQPALAELVKAFGSGILLEDGSLHRGELARLAFSSEESTALLNAITHPKITAETQRRFADAEAQGFAEIVYDMPLLVDNGLHKDMDFVVVVDAEPEVRIDRLVRYRGLDEDDARRRLGAQLTDAERNAVADMVIDNNGEIEALVPQVDELVRRIRLP
ncbi:Dephospho-CoA kinase [Corynebacterium freiburgense]|nr:Dephospho-CoA kinase [Corynebacterium freiburgense]